MTPEEAKKRIALEESLTSLTKILQRLTWGNNDLTEHLMEFDRKFRMANDLPYIRRLRCLCGNIDDMYFNPLVHKDSEKTVPCSSGKCSDKMEWTD